jgi:hypothetical protein
VEELGVEGGHLVHPTMVGPDGSVDQGPCALFGSRRQAQGGAMGVIRRHKVLTALALVAVLVAIAAWVVLGADQPGPPSVDEAVDRFEDGQGDGGPSATPRPPAGVYRYRGEGREHLSFPPLDQSDGTELPGTVTHDPDGCWTFRIDFNQGHWQSWHYCPTAAGDGYLELGGDSGQRWDLGVSSMGNTSHFRCPDNPVVWPADPGDQVDHWCTGTSSAIEGTTTSEGTWRFVGPTSLTVGTDEVDVLHFRGARELHGSQEGVESTEAWFRADGLLVRYERDIEARTSSPIGDITYTEEGWFELTDLRPLR